MVFTVNTTLICFKKWKSLGISDQEGNTKSSYCLILDSTDTNTAQYLQNIVIFSDSDLQKLHDSWENVHDHTFWLHDITECGWQTQSCTFNKLKQFNDWDFTRVTKVQDELVIVPEPCNRLTITNCKQDTSSLMTSATKGVINLSQFVNVPC